MSFACTARPLLRWAVILVMGLGPIGFTGGCGRSGDQAKIDTEIPKGWEITKEAMKERMKKMRNQGGAGGGRR